MILLQLFFEEKKISILYVHISVITLPYSLLHMTILFVIPPWSGEVETSIQNYHYIKECTSESYASGYILIAKAAATDIYPIYFADIYLSICMQ